MKEKQLYQWIKTERTGEYVYGDYKEIEDGIEYLYFEDGSRVNVELIGDYVIPVESFDDGYEVKTEIIEEWVEAKDESGKIHKIPGMRHGIEKKTLIPKKKTNPGPAKSPVTQTVSKENINKKTEKNPIFLLLEKAKKSTFKLTLEIELETVSKEFYKIVKETFENCEEEIMEYILTKIDTDKIKNQIKEQLLNQYNNE